MSANFFIFVDFSFLFLSWGFRHLFLGACGEGFVRNMLLSLFWLQEAIIAFELQLSVFEISDHINKELIRNRFIEVWVTMGLCHRLIVNILQGFQDSACEVTFFVETDFFAFIIEELGLQVFLVFVLFIFMFGTKRSTRELVLLSSSLAIELVANGWLFSIWILGLSFELLFHFLFELAELTVFTKSVPEDLPFDFGIEMYRNTEILAMPFVDFFLNKAQAQYYE